LKPSKKINPRPRRLNKKGGELGLIDDGYDDDPQDQLHSFEESSSFSVGHREEHIFGPSLFNLKGPHNRLDSFFVSCTTLGAQPTIDATWKKMEEADWECIARWWYDANIPFNATNFAYYQPMLDAIASCGSGFKGPSFHDI
jgi:hypothetical protein